MTSDSVSPDYNVAQGEGREYFWYLCAATLAGKSAIMLFAILPLIVGAMVDHLKFTTGSAGYLIAAEIGCIAVANVLAAIWINLVDWRRAVRVLLLCLVPLHLASGMISSQSLLLATRCVAGVLEGSVLALSFVMLGRTASPDRSFGIFFAASLSMSALNVLIAGYMLSVFGIAGLYLNLSLIGVVALVSTLKMRALPARSLHARNYQRFAWPAATALVLILFANFIYFVGQNSVWSYLERLGKYQGASAATISLTLFLALCCGIAASLLAAWQDCRFGRAVPVAAALSVALAGLVVLGGSSGGWPFVAGALLFMLANNYGHPFLLGYLAEVDPLGRYLTVSGAMQTGGMAVGPLIAGSVVDGTDVSNALWVGASAISFSALLFLPIMFLMRGLQRQPIA